MVPTLWKSALIPKKPKPTDLSRYRPVALIPLDMKCLERIVLKSLLLTVEPQLDPLRVPRRARS